jgi:RNA polymerase sigma-70 factor (ECF subfamily)
MHSYVSDVELMKLLKKKDQAAFAILYDKYAPCLYGQAIQWLKNEDLAAKVLEKSFIKIWQDCSSADCKPNLFVWLYSITYKIAQTEIAQTEQSHSHLQELVA